MAVASLILGILSIVLSWIPVAGWIICLIMGVVAIVLGVLGRKKQPEKKGMAVAGMVMGIIGVVFSLIWVIACGALVGAGAKAAKESGLDLNSLKEMGEEVIKEAQ